MTNIFKRLFTRTLPEPAPRWKSNFDLTPEQRSARTAKGNRNRSKTNEAPSPEGSRTSVNTPASSVRAAAGRISDHG